MNNISKIIRDNRDAQKLSLREFAAILGVSHTQVANYETGAQEPSASTIKIWVLSRIGWVRTLGLAVYECWYSTNVEARINDTLTVPDGECVIESEPGAEPVAVAV